VKAFKNFHAEGELMELSLCLEQIINGRYVEGFYIYARNIDDNEQPSYKMLTVLQNAGSGASSCKISGLQKFTTYEFFVVPFYKAVEGKPSNSRIARTLEDGEFHP
jgi:roundabout, axon guidance receptor 2